MIILMFSLMGCHPGKVSLRGDVKVDARDFFDAFTAMKTPVTISDTGLYRLTDTAVIGYAVLNQFVPDSVLEKISGKSKTKYQINPVGKIEKQDEIYLLVRFKRNHASLLETFLFDRKFHFLASLELLNNEKEKDYRHAVLINREPTFILDRERTSDTNQFLYTKNGYAYSADGGGFILLLNDSNEDIAKRDMIVDPIDTLPRKHRYSGNYAQDKRDFIAIRDGSDQGNYNFFIHFEKEDGTCIGELKGTMKMVRADKGEYREDGDACMITFTFTSKSVYVKENGDCGNHRGIRCYFDDSYEKRKEPSKKSERR